MKQMDDKKKNREQLIKELKELRLENTSLGLKATEAERTASVIKDLKKTEEALRDSEERYRIISSLTTDYIFRLKVGEDGSIKIDMISDNFLTTTKRTIEDIRTPDLWAKIIHADDLGKLMTGLHLLISEGGSTEIECRSHLADGTIRSVLVVAHAIKQTAHGPTKAIIGAVKDISTRKKSEAALATEQALLRTLVDLLPSFVYVKDRESRFLVANVACARYMGASLPQDLIGKTDADFYDPEDAARFRSDELEVLKGIPLVNKVEYGVSSNSTQNILLTTKVPFRDSDGNIIGLVGASHDITELKRTEEALIKAKEKAEESDRLKSAFLANMGHEIRTPMNGIMGFSDLLKNQTLSGEEQQLYVDIIEKSGARMLNIINDLIDISKIESGLMNVCISECNINENLEYVYSFFRHETEGKGLKFSYITHLPPDDAIIKTDKEKLNVVLINLIKNAIKFTSKGSIEFGYLLKPAREVSELAEVEFFVKDTGVGIPPEQREIIFERFRQGSESLDRSYEGIGLGLTISKSYVEMLGGKIWVESNSNNYLDVSGSIFYFTIPYNPTPVEKSFADHVISGRQEESAIKKLNVLIAEDDEASEILMFRALRTISKEILKVRTGVEAIQICRMNPEIDLVMMDIKMPEMDGYEATRQIRQFNTDVVIIAQTAYALAGEKEKALEAGCNDYIAKPIRKDELHLLIKKHFKN